MLGSDGSVRFEGARRIGKATNNEAEYEALIDGLGELARATTTPVLHVSDSQLLVRQMTGAYQVKAAHLQGLAEQARAVVERFEAVQHRHVPRDDPRIEHVDRLANEALD